MTGTSAHDPTPAPSNRAVVLAHASSPAFIQAVVQRLATLAQPPPLYLVGPEESRGEYSVLLERSAERGDVRWLTGAATPALAFLQSLPILQEAGHALFCRLLEPSEPAIATALLDSLIGDDGRLAELECAFSTRSELAIVGDVADRVSTRSATPTSLSRLELAATPEHPSPWDWAWHRSGCFWGRVDAFMRYRGHPAFTELEKERPGNGAGDNAWSAVFERLFGLAAGDGDGGDRRYGLLDRSLSGGTRTVLRVEGLDAPPALTEERRTALLRLQQAGLLPRYLLLTGSGLLDAPWYYSRHLPLMEGWLDCLAHHLQHPDQPLSAAHEAGLVGYAFTGEGLAILDAEGQPTRTLTMPHDYLSQALAPPGGTPEAAGAGGPKVSVLCPTYNHARHIRDCLASLVAQETPFDYEILVGDDASLDRTPEIVQEFALAHPQRLVPVLRERNLGPTGNVVDLVRRARGQYLALCEGDDFWSDPDKLRRQVEHLDANPRCAAHFHPVRVVDEARPSQQDLLPRNLPGQCFGSDHIGRTNFISTGSIMYRLTPALREAFFDAVAGSDLMPVDWLCHTLASRHGELHLSMRAMSVYRRHPGGIWSSQENDGFLGTWGFQYLAFFERLRAVLGDASHPVWCAHLLGNFAAMFRRLFERGDLAGLHRLVSGHPDIADLYFAHRRLPLRAHELADEASLAQGLRTAFSVSTIVLSCDSARFLQRCLDSVAAQEGLFGHEIIVADDASTDASLQIAQALVDRTGIELRILPSESRLGAAANFLRAANACSGRHIAICEGDDYWLGPHKLNRQLGALLDNPDAPMCFNWVLLDREHQPTVPHPGQASIGGDRIDFDELVAEPLTANLSCCLYRREVIDELPEQVKSTPYAGDWLLALHAASRGPLVFVRDLLSAYRIHRGGQWSRLDAATRAHMIAESYRSFLTLFPDHAASIKPRLERMAEGTRPPHVLALQSSNGARAHVDRVECLDGGVCLNGWFGSTSHGSRPDERKWLLLTTPTGEVVHAQRIENCPRPDVDRFFREKLGAAGLDFAWAGFRAVALAAPADGHYRLAIALDTGTGWAHAFLRHHIHVRQGIFEPILP